MCAKNQAIHGFISISYVAGDETGIVHIQAQKQPDKQVAFNAFAID